MKKILIAFVTFLQVNSYQAQNVTLCLGQDATVCPNQTVTINDCNNIGGGAAAGTAQYTITTIPYAPDPFNQGTPVNLSDDAVSSALNIGFPFCFFGNTYNQFYIGSNGWVGFTAGQTTYFTSASIPSTGALVPKNCIMAPWQDWHPGTGGNVGFYIRYQTLGTAPNRRLVVSWNSVPMYSCTTSYGTFQIVLFETTNNIETRIQNKPNCTGWAGGTAVHGLHNLAGNVAVAVPGRNSTQWTTTNDARRFTPAIQWGNTLGASFPYNAGSLTVNPVPAGTTGYFLKASCGNGGAISDTTWLTLNNPTVSVTAVNDQCTQQIGSVTATPGAGTGPFTYSWSPGGGTTQTVNNLGAGTYTVTMTGAGGCTASASGTVADNPVTYNVTSTLVSCAGGNDGTATASTTPNFATNTYQWSNGQTTATATGLSAGTYTCTVSAGNGCVGTVTITVSEIPGMQVSIANQTNVTCNSANDGTASVTASLGTAPYSYQWVGSTSTTNSATDLFAGASTVTVSDANGCSQTVTINLTEPSPLSIINFTPDTQICPGASIQLSGSGSGGSSPYIYSWSQGTSIISAANTVTVTPTQPSTQYCLTLNEQCGSPSTQRCVTITHPTPIIPTVIPNSTKECVPGTFTFYNQSGNLSEVASTEYTFTNGSTYNVLGTENLTATFPAVGLYGVNMSVTSIYGCIYTQSFNNIIEVTPLPVANFNLSKNPLTWFETMVQTSDNSTGGVINWEWSSPGAVSVNPNGSSATIKYQEGVTGSYPVQLVVTTEQGCQDSITLTVVVNPDVILCVPNSFTPDDDEHNQSWKFYIDGIDFQNFKCEIFNRWGEKIWESLDPDATWDGTYGIGRHEKVPPGAYTWKISYKEKDNDGRQYRTGYVNVLK
ncbi:MAG: hypothetical protein RL264_2780 [Bacteroidota bacterium]|jgi:gliding motility-associated-like protein